MTNQQILFYDEKMKLDHLNKIKETRSLTPAEKDEEQEILKVLFESIVRFGMSKAKMRLAKYKSSNDALQDIQQDLSIIFLERLPHYNPRLAAPTTYYLPYFNQVITEYILVHILHMSKYDAYNVAIVCKAIEYFESLGIQYTVCMIADKTGLSIKVVVKTLRIVANSIYSDIDAKNKAKEQKSSIPTPEEKILKEEMSRDINKAVSSLLTDEEKRLLFYRLNLNGKRRSYQQVADRFGIPLKDVKKK